MDIYAIGRYTDKKGKNTHYILVDLDDNNKIITVSKEQIISVLNSKKLKINNIKLVDNSLVGKYYSLQKLPIFFSNNHSNSCCTLCLKIKDNQEFTIVNYSNGFPSIEKCNLYQFKTFMNLGRIINYEPSKNDILCEKIDSSINPLKKTRDLNKEVLEPSIPWTIDDFKRYMDSNNYYYAITEDYDRIRLNYIDTRCLNVKVPEGITHIDTLYDTDNISSINSIILPSSLVEFKNITMNRREAVENLFEATDKDLYNKLSYITINSVYVLPNSTKGIELYGFSKVLIVDKLILGNRAVIRGGFNYSYINEINLDFNGKLSNSFNNCKLNNTVININCDEIIRSLKFIDNVSTINIGNKIKHIEESLCNINCTSINILGASLRTLNRAIKNCENLMLLDFSNQFSLTRITNSLLYLTNIKSIYLPDSLECVRYSFNGIALSKLDFSRCNNLTELVSSIKYCENITELKLPPNIENMKDTCELTMINKEILLPYTVNAITCGKGKYPTWIVPNNFSEVQSEYSENRTFKKGIITVNGGSIPNFKFKDNHGSKFYFSDRIFEYMEANEIDTDAFPAEYALFKSETFLGCKVTTFNSKCFKSVDTIPSQCFKQCSIKNIILHDNIKEIGDNVFEDTSTIRNLVLGKNIETISPKILNKMKSNACTIYVVKDTPAAKFMAKRKYIVIEVSSTDEAIDKIFNTGKTSEAKQTKIEFLLSNHPEYHILTKEPFLKDAGYTYGIIEKVMNNVEENNKLTLDTSKFRSIGLHNFNVLHNEISKFRQIRNNKIQENKQQVNKLPDSFIGMCNLITRMSDRLDIVYDTELKNIGASNILMIDSCDNGEIVYVVTYKESKLPSKLLFILIENEIVYITGFNGSHMYQEGCSEKFKVHMLNHGFFIKESRCNINTEIAVNDIIDAYTQWDQYMVLNGALIPPKFKKEIKESIEESLIYIGSSNKESTFLMSTREDKEYNVLFYDSASARFLEVIAKFEFDTSNGCGFDRIKFMKIKAIYELNEIDKINKAYTTKLTKAFTDNRNIDAIKLLFSNNTSNTKCNNDSFDIEENKQLVEFADAMYKYNVDSVDKLSTPVIKEMLKLNIFYDIKDSIEKFNTKFKPKAIDTADGNSLILEYAGKTSDTDVWIYVNIDENTNLKSKTTLKVAYRPLSELVQMLYFIGNARALNKHEKDNLVETGKIMDVDRYWFLYSHSLNTNGIKVNVAVDKVYGYTYWIGEYLDTDFVELFRFKSTTDAISILLNTVYNKTAKAHLRMSLANLIDKLLFGRELSYNNSVEFSFERLYMKIQEGLSNDSPYPWSEREFFKLLSKQPNKSTD